MVGKCVLKCCGRVIGWEEAVEGEPRGVSNTGSRVDQPPKSRTEIVSARVLKGNMVYILLPHVRRSRMLRA